MLRIFILSIALLLLVPIASGEPRGYFADLRSLTADFSQTLYDERGQVLERANGRMYMRRPGQFRWDYRSPYQQLIVADGSRIWLYDQSLEQITVRPLDEALSATPLALLGGTEPLERIFAIERLPAQGQLEWYRLQPHESRAEVSSLALAFESGELRVLEMEDGLRRRTRLALANVERNPELAASLFEFIPPPGVDVLGLEP